MRSRDPLIWLNSPAGTDFHSLSREGAPMTIVVILSPLACDRGPEVIQGTTPGA